MCCKRSKTNESRARFFEFTAGRNTGNMVSENDESVLATKHCRYVVPTEIKLRPTFDDENENVL
jgi:hypothetical protein